MSIRPEAPRQTQKRLDSIQLLRGLLFATAIFATWRWWRLMDADLRNYERGLPFAALALVCTALAVIRPSIRADWRQTSAAWLTSHRLEIAAVTAIVVLAAAMRLYALSIFPTGDHTGFEEAQTGGIAYNIVLHKLMPLEFAFTNYAAALGFLLFGFHAWAMRVVFLFGGIFSVVPMYLLLRRLVTTPAALLTTVLFAACRWMAVASRFADEAFFGITLVIPTALLLVLVIQKRSGLAALGLGALCGMLSYEYTCYRVVPYLIVATLGVAFLIEAYRQIKQHSAAKLVSLLPLGLAFVIGGLVILMPLIAATSRGDITYMEAFHRHLDHEPHPAVFGLLPANWPHRAEHALRTFSPLPTDPGEDWRPLNLRGTIWFDPLTATLAIPAMLFALVTFYRPYRLLFLAWVTIGLFVGGVIPIVFNDQRFTGLIPAMFVLIAFLFDGILKLCRRPMLRRAALVVMAGLGLFAVAANAQSLDTQLHDPDQRAVFHDPLQEVCNMTRTLGPDTYIYISGDNQPADAFFQPVDYNWACYKLRGEGFDATARSWPRAIGQQADDVAYIVLQRLPHDDDPEETRPPPPSPAIERILALPTARKLERDNFLGYSLYGIVVSQQALLTLPALPPTAP